MARGALFCGVCEVNGDRGGPSLSSPLPGAIKIFSSTVCINGNNSNDGNNGNHGNNGYKGKNCVTFSEFGGRQPALWMPLARPLNHSCIEIEKQIELHI